MLEDGGMIGLCLDYLLDLLFLHQDVETNGRRPVMITHARDLVCKMDRGAFDTAT